VKLRVRARLVLAFVLVAVPPLLLLALGVNTLLIERFQTDVEARLASAVNTVTHAVAEQRGRADKMVSDIAQRELPAAEPGDDGGVRVATTLAEAHDLPLLEVLDAEGRVLTSHHWRAGVGLPDRDRAFGGPGALRVETVARGFGAVQALAVAPSQPGQWRGAPVTVRAGFILDEAFVAGLSSVMGVEVALRDEVRRVWITPKGSALAQWTAPPAWNPDHGEVVLAGAPYRWSAAQLNPQVWAVVAAPRSSLDATLRDVRRLGIGLAALSLLGAVAASFLFAARIARPVSDLAKGAARVADGDLQTAVQAQGDDEVAELAVAFNRMTAELRDSRERLLQAERVAAWREMARRLAHELKNPLFPIQLSIETLRRALAQEPQAEADAGQAFRALFRESSETILQELGALRRIIEEFSQFARMPQPELRATDVNEVVERVLDLYRPRADGVAIEAELAAGLPAVAADPDLLARALGNLVGNAFDAMGSGGVLRVRTAPEPDGVRLEVEDTGPGLTDEQRTRLFTPYYTTKRGGTGLGLAIVQGIVSDHGGRIQVRSAPGEGTAFTLLLPLARPAAPAGGEGAG
jgi:nitrogen fixation/metabolism regulation signal transduction histidine kinase